MTAVALPYQPHHCDKSEWRNGPWIMEDDLKAWRDPSTGYDCAVVRHPQFGHLCGYVRVPEGHSLHGKGYSQRAKLPRQWLERSYKMDEDIGVMSLFCASINMSEDMAEATLDLIFQCHGSLTFSKRGWLGFDCGHAGDLSPGMRHSFDPVLENVYRDMLYVTLQCERLAAQLQEYDELVRA